MWCAMEESDRKLSQPTVFALTFLFLIVMNLEQVRCTQEIKVLYHSASTKFLTMHENGVVSTEPRFNQCLVLKTVKLQDGKPIMSISNYQENMFLCFNKNGKLVARRHLSENCHFYEELDEASFVEYRQLTPGSKRPPRVVTFSVKGKPQKRRNPKKANAQFIKMPPNEGECTKMNPVDPSYNETHNHVRHKGQRFGKKPGGRNKHKSYV